MQLVNSQEPSFRKALTARNGTRVLHRLELASWCQASTDVHLGALVPRQSDFDLFVVRPVFSAEQVRWTEQVQFPGWCGVAVRVLPHQAGEARKVQTHFLSPEMDSSALGMSGRPSITVRDRPDLEDPCAFPNIVMDARQHARQSTLKLAKVGFGQSWKIRLAKVGLGCSGCSGCLGCAGCCRV